MDDQYKSYLHDLGTEVVYLAQKAKLRTVNSDDAYDKGRLFSYYEMLDLMKQQAATFGISLREIGLDGVNIEEFLRRR